jgi:hypothetical protein
MKSFAELFIDMKKDLLTTLIDGKILAFGMSFGAVLAFIKTYMFSDMKYLIWLVIAVLLDSLSKFYSLWFVEIVKPSLKVLINKFLNKSLKYTIYLIGSFLLINFEVDGKRMEFLQSFNVILYGILIVKEVNSIMHNLGMKLPRQITDVINSKFDNLNEDKP